MAGQGASAPMHARRSRAGRLSNGAAVRPSSCVESRPVLRLGVCICWLMRTWRGASELSLSRRPSTDIAPPSQGFGVGHAFDSEEGVEAASLVVGTREHPGATARPGRTNRPTSRGRDGWRGGACHDLASAVRIVSHRRSARKSRAASQHALTGCMRGCC